MSTKYRNAGPVPYRGIAPGDVGTLDLTPAEQSRHVKSGRLVVQDGSTDAEPKSGPENPPVATAPEHITPPDVNDGATEQEDD